MVRSLDYAVQSVLLGVTDVRGRPPGMIRPEDRPALEPWAPVLVRTRDPGVRLGLHRGRSSRPSCCLAARRSIHNLLELFLLEKSLLEIDAELTDRPDWVEIPLRAAIRLLGNDPADPAPASVEIVGMASRRILNADDRPQRDGVAPGDRPPDRSGRKNPPGTRLRRHA